MKYRSGKAQTVCFFSVLLLALGFLPPARASDFDRDQSIEEGARRFPGLTPEQLQNLTLDSFESVFFDKVNRTRLLSRPTPGFIRKQIYTLLATFYELCDAVDEGTAAIVEKRGPEGQLRIVDRIQAKAAKIHGIFAQYFLETHSSSLTVHLPIPRDDFGQFVLFLHKTRKLMAFLSREITDYFFDTRPRVVKVADFDDSYSISVVTDILVQMSQEVKKHHTRSS